MRQKTPRLVTISEDAVSTIATPSEVAEIDPEMKEVINRFMTLLRSEQAEPSITAWLCCKTLR